MSSVSSLFPQPNSLSSNSTNSIDNTVKSLVKRVADAVKSGALTTQQATDLTKALEEIQQSYDAGTANGSLSTTDIGQFSQILRGIAQVLGGNGQTTAPATAAGQTQTVSAGQDSDGDNDGSTGVSLSA